MPRRMPGDIEPASRDIMELREVARAEIGLPPLEVCPTCTRPFWNPWRGVNENGSMLGCVDACHTSHFTGILSSSASHHFSPSAVKIRREERDRLLGLGVKKAKKRKS